MAFDITLHTIGYNFEPLRIALRVFDNIAGGDFASLMIKVGFIFSLFLAFIMALMGMRASHFLKQFILLIVLGGLLSFTTVNVALRPMIGNNDIPGQGQDFAVKLPLILAFPLYITNEIGFFTARAIDRAFGCDVGTTNTLATQNTANINLPGKYSDNQACYSYGGFGGLMATVAMLDQYWIMDDTSFANLQIYIQNCLFFAMDTGMMTWQGLGETSDISEYLCDNSPVNIWTPVQLNEGDSANSATGGCNYGLPSCNDAGSGYLNCNCASAWSYILGKLKNRADNVFPQEVHATSLFGYASSLTGNNGTIE
ncbi:MAG TPA: hypothetical protein EYP19_13295, partial [Desulfobacterales bacterium]|nr:hypothetical protein [Desulfobacterales bacterium]